MTHILKDFKNKKHFTFTQQILWVSNNIRLLFRRRFGLLSSWDRMITQSFLNKGHMTVLYLKVAITLVLKFTWGSSPVLFPFLQVETSHYDAATEDGRWDSHDPSPTGKGSWSEAEISKSVNLYLLFLDNVTFYVFAHNTFGLYDYHRMLSHTQTHTQTHTLCGRISLRLRMFQSHWSDELPPPCGHRNSWILSHKKNKLCIVASVE